MNTAGSGPADRRGTGRPAAVGDGGAVADRNRVRVMTYNVRYAGLEEGPLSWDARRDGVADAIGTARPDAVAVQECWLGQLDDLRERLPGYEWVASRDRSGEHTPIGYRTDRLALRDSGAFGLAPNGARDVPGWDAELPRTATHATFDRAESAGTGTAGAFSLLSVHFDHHGRQARVEGARLVLDRLPPGPVAVAGDLNCEPGSEPYRVLAADLTDAATGAPEHHGPTETYVGFGGAAVDEDGPPRPKRIDYVFVQGFDVASYRVIEARDDPPPSDHRPVLVELLPEI